MAISILRASLLAVALSVPAVPGVMVQQASAQTLPALPTEISSVIDQLPAGDQTTILDAIQALKAAVASGSEDAVLTAVAGLTSAISVVPEQLRASFSVNLAANIANESRNASPTVRIAAGRAVAGAAGIASNAQIVGAANVISTATLNRLTTAANTLLAGQDPGPVIAAVDQPGSPTG